MTRLILPVEQDAIDSWLIRNIELQQLTPAIEPISIQVFELPPELVNILQPEIQIESISNSTESVDSEVGSDSNVENERNDHVIDWWAEARKQSEESDDNAFRRWLIEEGYDRYISIMQGPLPVAKSARGTSLSADDKKEKVYKNMYGELEVKISDNCTMQMQSTGQEVTDFERNLPARIVCKPLPKKKLSFERPDRE